MRDCVALREKTRRCSAGTKRKALDVSYVLVLSQQSGGSVNEVSSEEMHDVMCRSVIVCVYCSRGMNIVCVIC